MQIRIPLRDPRPPSLTLYPPRCPISVFFLDYLPLPIYLSISTFPTALASSLRARIHLAFSLGFFSPSTTFFLLALSLFPIPLLYVVLLYFDVFYRRNRLTMPLAASLRSLPLTLFRPPFLSLNSLGKHRSVLGLFNRSWQESKILLTNFTDGVICSFRGFGWVIFTSSVDFLLWDKLLIFYQRRKVSFSSLTCTLF